MDDEPNGGPAEPETLLAGPDLRGIEVDDVAGKPTGAVYGTLSDFESGLIRYVDVELHDDSVHVLVPIGHLRLRHELHGLRLHLRAATRDDLRTVPPLEGQPDEAFERAVLSAHSLIFHGAGYYKHPAYDHSHIYAGENPVLLEEQAHLLADRAAVLAFLSGSGFRVADGEPDIRRWPVLLANGVGGVVDDLVIDTAQQKVRYIVFRAGDNGVRRALPIGYVRLDLERRVLQVPAIALQDLPSFPALADDHLDPATEEKVFRHLVSLPDGPRRFLRPDFRVPNGLAERGGRAGRD